nr:MAG TPA: hypothetical protein [Caudoviricetes sp.]
MTTLATMYTEIPINPTHAGIKHIPVRIYSYFLLI